MSTYKIKSNLSEVQIESDVSSFFGWISKATPFRLLDVNEQLTGADKKFYDSGFAFFMQFKVSEGLKPIDEVPSSTKSNRSKLEDVREFRKARGLEDNPSLYFELRRKAKTASDLQHNVLLNYANKPCSQAFYVAPLHLDKTKYYTCLFDSVNRYQNLPFKSQKYKMYRDNWVSHIGFVPFLKEHISIVPHERVTTHKHYYSFSQTGCEISWHSPEYINDGPMRLSDMLSREIQACLDYEKFKDIKDLSNMLIDEMHDSGSYIEDPIERIQEWGKKLYSENRIKPILLLGNSELIKKYFI